MNPMIKKFDVTVSPQDNPLYQRIIEVDAVGEEEALEFVRWYFSVIHHQHVFVTAVTAHRYRKPKPVTIMVRLSNMFGMFGR